MNPPEKHKPTYRDVTMQKVAREIAMDIREIDEILKVHEVTPEQWQEIQNSTIFQSYLRSSMEEWNSSLNTKERVTLKSLAFIEESLPEFFARAHDSDENLPAKVEVLKTIARFAGVGGPVDVGGVGERLSVTINLGADKQVKFEKDVTPKGNSQIIEGDYS